MKNTKYKIDWRVLIIITCFIGLIAYMFITDKNRKNKWADPTLDKRYTQGVIIEYKHRGRGGPSSFVYNFKLGNRNYTNEYLILSKMQQLPKEELKTYIGARYCVKFIVDCPKYSELLLDKPVSDSILTAPEEGWLQLPE